MSNQFRNANLSSFKYSPRFDHDIKIDFSDILAESKPLKLGKHSSRNASHKRTANLTQLVKAIPL